MFLEIDMDIHVFLVMSIGMVRRWSVMKKKKIVFFAYAMVVGGIEKTLLTVLNKLDPDVYDITLVLQKKEGPLLDLLPHYVHVKEYRISDCKCVVFRKIWNRLKLLYWCKKYNHHYDVGISYCGYCIPSGILSRKLAKKSIIWIHSDYRIVFKEDDEAYKHYFSQYHMDKFHKIVFVSHKARHSFIEIYPQLEEKCMTIPNQVEVDNIRKMAEEVPSIDIKKDRFCFVNVSRHEEESKRLSRLFHACARLVDQGYDFQFLFVGGGEDHEEYQLLAHHLGIKKYVTFVGEQLNPYPYMKQGDVFVLSSEYEGGPMVIYEALALHKNIITTDVGDVSNFIQGDIGHVVDKHVDALCDAMEYYLINGCQPYTLDYDKINADNMYKITSLFE